jgi:hypothetical protein
MMLFRVAWQSFAGGRFVELYEIDVIDGAEDPWRLVALGR